PHRGVLGQRDGRVVLGHAKDRVLRPPVLADPGRSPPRGRSLDRDRLQPSPAALQPRLHQPGRVRERRRSRPGRDRDRRTHRSGQSSLINRQRLAGKPTFARMQALWFLLADAIRPHIKTVPIQEVLAQSAKARPRSLRHRRLTAPVRVEALTVRDALHGNIARRWLLSDLAEMVHLSPKQLVRAFSVAYGKTPRAYLGRLRVEAMARLLREENLTVDAAAHRVGWSRNQAAEMFARHVGTTPGRYRL